MSAWSSMLGMWVLVGIGALCVAYLLAYTIAAGARRGWTAGGADGKIRHERPTDREDTRGRHPTSDRTLPGPPHQGEPAQAGPRQGLRGAVVGGLHRGR